jgi:hypothetical protein
MASSPISAPTDTDIRPILVPKPALAAPANPTTAAFPTFLAIPVRLVSLSSPEINKLARQLPDNSYPKANMPDPSRRIDLVQRIVPNVRIEIEVIIIF